jgi:Holliday junction resolvasome RuvABC endonuclease subunit
MCRKKEETMKIIALDSGTKTGWATNDGETFSGIQDFSLKRGESPGMRFLMFQSWLKKMIETIKPDMIIYERAHHRGGGATEVGVGLTTIIQTVCAEHKVEHVALHSATLKKHATGKGNSSKDDMMSAGKTKGWTFEDDNECDALWLLDYAKINYGGE